MQSLTYIILTALLCSQMLTIKLSRSLGIDGDACNGQEDNWKATMPVSFTFKTFLDNIPNQFVGVTLEVPCEGLENFKFYVTLNMPKFEYNTAEDQAEFGEEGVCMNKHTMEDLQQFWTDNIKSSQLAVYRIASEIKGDGVYITLSAVDAELLATLDDYKVPFDEGVNNYDLSQISLDEIEEPLVSNLTQFSGQNITQEEMQKLMTEKMQQDILKHLNNGKGTFVENTGNGGQIQFVISSKVYRHDSQNNF